jgi:hypothetical protein
MQHCQFFLIYIYCHCASLHILPAINGQIASNMLFGKTKKPQGFKGREAFPTFKVTLTVTQVRLNRYQKNAGLINFSVFSL